MVVHRAMLRRIYDWCIDAAHKPYALWILGSRGVRRKLVLSGPARHHAAADVAGAPAAGVAVRGRMHRSLRWPGGVLGYAIGALLYDSLGHWLIHLYGLGGKVETFRASLCRNGARSSSC